MPKSKSTRNSLARAARPAMRAMIDALESRRMLAVFNATNGDDEIRAYLDGGGIPHVVINNNDQFTLDTDIRINCLGGDDDIYMDGWAPDMIVDLGGGWNQVYYGWSNQVLFGELPPATILGTTGTYPPDDDEVYFDDTSGGTISRTYEFTPTSVMNQTLVDVDDVVFDTRQGNAGFPNVINFSGSPSTVYSSLGGFGTLNIGTSSAPVDLDSLNVRITTDIKGDKNVFDLDVNSSNQPFQLATVSNPPIQDLIKGSFRASFYETAINSNEPVSLFIFGGPTNDVFNVSGVTPLSHINCYGAGGSDILQTNNHFSNNQDNDLDEIFVGSIFAFFGGSGTGDYLDLNDINDETIDGDTVYDANGSQFRKNNVPFITYDGSTEQINMVGDNGPNDLYFTTSPGTSAIVAGAGGNDSFYPAAFSLLSGMGTAATVVGGSTADVDQLLINTAGDNAITQYDFNNGNTFSWQVGATTKSISYDGSLELFSLVGNTSGTPWNVNRINPNLNLTIDASAGNDVFSVGGGDLDSNGFAHVTIGGAAGSDSITFDDSLDSGSATYMLNDVALTKPGVSIVYSGFESTTVKTPGVGTAQQPANTVNIMSSTAAVTIMGSGVRANAISIGSGNLSNISANVTLAMSPTGTDVLNINDHTNTQLNVEYQVHATDVTRALGATITHFFSLSGVETLNVNGNTQDNAIAAFSTPPGLTTNLTGGGGNDTFYIGQGNVDAQLLGNIVAVGGTGSDTVRFNNTSDGTLESQTLTDGSFTDGATTFWSSVESIRVLSGSGGGTINVPLVTVPVIIDGNLGPDTVTVGDGNLDIGFFAPLTFNGGGGADLLLIDDRFDGGNDDYEMLAGLFRKSTPAQSPSIFWDSAVETQTLQCNNGNNDIFVGTVISSRMNIFANGGNDNVVTNGGHDITVDTGSEIGSPGDTLFVNFDGSSATVQTRANDTIADINVRFGGKLQVIGGTLNVTNSLSLDQIGTLDMAGGSMLLRNTATLNGAALNSATLRTLITRGWAAGAWNGTNDGGAINSSLANGSATADCVGYWREAVPPLSAIGPYTINANDALIRYTLYGDANLDRQVNLADYNRVAANYGQPNRVWYQGDFNYDNIANLADYNLLSGNYGQTVTAGGAESSDEPITALPKLRSQLSELA